MDNLETQEALSTRDRTWKNGQSRDTGDIKRQNVEEWTIQRHSKHQAHEIKRGIMDNLETQETLSTRDRTWKNGQSRDTGNIKRQNVEQICQIIAYSTEIQCVCQRFEN